MSDVPRGPGWQRGADGKWHPPVQPPAGRTPGNVTAALVCSILSFVVCPGVLAVVALVLASSASKEIKASRGALDGGSTLQVARVLAWVNVAFFVLGIVSIVAVTIIGNNAEKTLRDAGSTLEMLYFVWPS